MPERPRRLVIVRKVASAPLFGELCQSSRQHQWRADPYYGEDRRLTHRGRDSFAVHFKYGQTTGCENIAMLGRRLLARHRPLIALPRAEAQEFDRPACPGVRASETRYTILPAAANSQQKATQARGPADPSRRAWSERDYGVRFDTKTQPTPRHQTTFVLGSRQPNAWIVTRRSCWKQIGSMMCQRYRLQKLGDSAFSLAGRVVPV